ncbi:MAG: SDR family NAD(P)-dependent oxidoreductase [Spirochaetia bacterium]|nr:SDR family NAD(P)-dependent oxidoreductase [Spirochaetia bacterium]
MSKQKKAVITGATGAIGLSISRLMAEKNYETILVAKNEDKAKKAVKDIIKKSKNNNVRYEIVNLESYNNIKGFSSKIDGSLDVLINNAAVTPRTKTFTPEGLEIQFAVNIMSYFWMTLELLDSLKKSAPSRVVNVASYWAGDLNIADLNFEKRPYNNNLAYRQSKQANRMLSFAFSERLKKFNISVNSCHPGEVNSALSNSLGFGGHESADKGAETPVWLATEPIGQERTGLYYEYLSQTPCRFIYNDSEVDALYDECLKYC